MLIDIVKMNNIKEPESIQRCNTSIRNLQTEKVNNYNNKDNTFNKNDKQNYNMGHNDHDENYSNNSDKELMNKKYSNLKPLTQTINNHSPQENDNNNMYEDFTNLNIEKGNHNISNNNIKFEKREDIENNLFIYENDENNMNNLINNYNNKDSKLLETVKDRSSDNILSSSNDKQIQEFNNSNNFLCFPQKLYTKDDDIDADFDSFKISGVSLLDYLDDCPNNKNIFNDSNIDNNNNNTNDGDAIINCLNTKTLNNSKDEYINDYAYAFQNYKYGNNNVSSCDIVNKENGQNSQNDKIANNSIFNEMEKYLRTHRNENNISSKMLEEYLSYGFNNIKEQKQSELDNYVNSNKKMNTNEISNSNNEKNARDYIEDNNSTHATDGRVKSSESIHKIRADINNKDNSYVNLSDKDKILSFLENDDTTILSNNSNRNKEIDNMSKDIIKENKDNNLNEINCAELSLNNAIHNNINMKDFQMKQNLMYNKNLLDNPYFDFDNECNNYFNKDDIDNIRDNIGNLNINSNLYYKRNNAKNDNDSNSGTTNVSANGSNNINKCNSSVKPILLDKKNIDADGIGYENLGDDIIEDNFSIFSNRDILNCDVDCLGNNNATISNGINNNSNRNQNNIANSDVTNFSDTCEGNCRKDFLNNNQKHSNINEKNYIMNYMADAGNKSNINLSDNNMISDHEKNEFFMKYIKQFLDDNYLKDTQNKKSNNSQNSNINNHTDFEHIDNAFLQNDENGHINLVLKNKDIAALNGTSINGYLNRNIYSEKKNMADIVNCNWDGRKINGTHHSSGHDLKNFIEGHRNEMINNTNDATNMESIRNAKEFNEGNNYNSVNLSDLDDISSCMKKRDQFDYHNIQAAMNEIITDSNIYDNRKGTKNLVNERNTGNAHINGDPNYHNANFKNYNNNSRNSINNNIRDSNISNKLNNINSFLLNENGRKSEPFDEEKYECSMNNDGSEMYAHDNAVKDINKCDERRYTDKYNNNLMKKSLPFVNPMLLRDNENKSNNTKIELENADIFKNQLEKYKDYIAMKKSIMQNKNLLENISYENGNNNMFFGENNIMVNNFQNISQNNTDANFNNYNNYNRINNGNIMMPSLHNNICFNQEKIMKMLSADKLNNIANISDNNASTASSAAANINNYFGDISNKNKQTYLRNIMDDKMAQFLINNSKRENGTEKNEMSNRMNSAIADNILMRILPNNNSDNNNCINGYNSRIMERDDPNKSIDNKGDHSTCSNGNTNDISNTHSVNNDHNYNRSVNNTVDDENINDNLNTNEGNIHYNMRNCNYVNENGSIISNSPRYRNYNGDSNMMRWLSKGNGNYIGSRNSLNPNNINLNGNNYNITDRNKIGNIKKGQTVNKMNTTYLKSPTDCIHMHDNNNFDMKNCMCKDVENNVYNEAKIKSIYNYTNNNNNYTSSLHFNNYQNTMDLEKNKNKYNNSIRNIMEETNMINSNEWLIKNNAPNNRNGISDCNSNNNINLINGSSENMNVISHNNNSSGNINASINPLKIIDYTHCGKSASTRCISDESIMDSHNINNMHLNLKSYGNFSNYIPNSKINDNNNNNTMKYKTSNSDENCINSGMMDAYKNYDKMKFNMKRASAICPSTGKNMDKQQPSPRYKPPYATNNNNNTGRDNMIRKESKGMMMQDDKDKFSKGGNNRYFGDKTNNLTNKNNNNNNTNNNNSNAKNNYISKDSMLSDNFLVIKKYTAKYEVQIDPFNGFDIAKRIIGLKGTNMKKICVGTDCKLRLRGRGSGYLEGEEKKEANESLHLCVSCQKYDHYILAKKLIEQLLEKIYMDYDTWLYNHGKPYANLKPKIYEKFIPLFKFQQNVNQR
ncbi:conserved Plasmodium protein, unknown function [Plasmodium chabaudi chabaudi]|uniref:KHDC4/BBP-like KH-domain type I domain-containing protein n=1 Tax=Plasmodium chabaudi chabaudi TaxID=31271 RepID=A0A1C6YJ68_PLACU|nr:conserved Plasmodium protein, unknown function [Plasmodium chabaudi chabaudi]